MFHSTREALWWFRRCKLSRRSTRHSFCSTIKTNDKKATASVTENAELAHYKETYKKLDNLDFMTAAKILFQDTPNKKKFGLDFHLVQLFFACLPSLAVYLVAQYARAEMKEMDVKLEKKRKQEEEQKAKESEINNIVENEAKSDPELLEVKVRLGKLEEAVKEIVVVTKKQLTSSKTNIQEESSSKKHPAKIEQSRSDSNKAIDKDTLGQKKAD